MLIPTRLKPILRIGSRRNCLASVFGKRLKRCECLWKNFRLKTNERAVLAAAIAANDRQDFAGDVARTARRREKDKGPRDFLRLGGTLHRRIAAEFGDRFTALAGAQMLFEILCLSAEARAFILR
jgi:hypothetical protein